MTEIRQRHEVTVERDGRTFVFVAEPDAGRLSIRETGERGEEVCGLTLADPEEISTFFEGLHRVLGTARRGGGEQPVGTPPRHALGEWRRVIITERGRPAHVLLTFEDYQRLTDSRGSIIERLGLPPGIEEVELEIPPLRDPARPADLG